ncbi:hypothetical protein QS306_01225 [Paraburkholderia bonniea]|uniref:hypothetical protein n=1 Tax=Paraburkholderia bonniea TaxID=2152891 RepID=UPI0012920B3F|nr:hypothetical protein [Paraburkholderia bonniea]WJF90338.1 hypothetical protein QS306_01225 [Paraburkholderia bonniea]WJF93653.1 hypothetical protein QS308_01225 [Paraburkholderia bonniea]
MKLDNQPSSEMIDLVKHIPLYQDAIQKKYFPILEKAEIARDFPENWMTPQLENALSTGKAEYILSTGTNHARMHLIRPPYFLLHSYYQLWSEHPDIAFTWQQNCQRVSITTVMATEHVIRVNARQSSTRVNPDAHPALEPRRLDARTLYLNQQADPALWSKSEVECMLSEIALIRQTHPQGWYHLDCSSYYLAHLLRKISRFGLQHEFHPPASIIHAYEYTPRNVRRFLLQRFDCPVVDLVGSTELGYIYYSDCQGNYSPYLGQMQAELLPVSGNRSIYSLIVSSVRNPYMPLIRYRSGDCVQTTDGSANPEKIARFCGREKELLSLDSGLFAHGNFDDWISEASAEIFLYQLHLLDAPQAQLRYTTFDEQPIPADAAAALQHRIAQTTGLDCTLEHCSHIPIGRSGKYVWLTRAGQNREKEAHV